MFSSRLKALRQEHKLSQEELANMLGYSRTTISNYEQETRIPSADVLSKIADHFDVSIDYLLGRTNINLTLKDYLSKTTPSILLFYDSITGEIIDCSSSALSFYGYSRNEMLKKDIFELNTLPKHEIKKLMKKIRNKEQEVFHLKHKIASGKIIDVRITTTNLLMKNRLAIGSLIQDITSIGEDNNKIEAELIRALSKANQYKTPYKKDHPENVSKLSCEIAKQLNLPLESLKSIRISSLLHDIGELNIPDDILNKHGKLSKNEFNIVKEHPEYSAQKIKNIPFKEPIAKIILQHHERIDGSGYPYGLKGSNIIIEAKILAVADVLVAMTSIRPYRQALSLDSALAEIKKFRGKKYDEQVVDICINLFRKKHFEFDK